MVIIYSKLCFTIDVLPGLLFVVIVKAAKGRWQVNQCNHNLTSKISVRVVKQRNRINEFTYNIIISWRYKGKLQSKLKDDFGVLHCQR